MLTFNEIVQSATYEGAIEDVVEREIEDFVYGLFNEIVGEETLDYDEFHERYSLHGGWGDAREFVLGVFKDCGLEW